jgi:spore coat protein CotH
MVMRTHRLIREVMGYDILQQLYALPHRQILRRFMSMASYWGLYSNAENINKDFCNNHFYSSSGTFFKCNPIGIPGPTTKSNLKTIVGVDSTGYFPRYELKSNTGWNELVDLCEVVTTNTPALDANLDMDRAIWMLAFNNLMVNLDSYSGVFAQNYYLYKDQTGHFNPIIWDLNMSFGGFPFLQVVGIRGWEH